MLITTINTDDGPMGVCTPTGFNALSDDEDLEIISNVRDAGGHDGDSLVADKEGGGTNMFGSKLFSDSSKFEIKHR